MNINVRHFQSTKIREPTQEKIPKNLMLINLQLSILSKNK